jgi:protease I
MPKVLMLCGDAAESLEVMYPYQRLLEEGYEVDMAGPSKKKLQFVVHDFVDGYDTYTEKPGYTWPADVAFADVDPADYAALVIPGGRAPEYIRNDAYPALQPDVERAGAEFVDGAGIVDGQMVSARAWPDHPEWMREFIQLLKQHAPVEPHAAAVTG